MPHTLPPPPAGTLRLHKRFPSRILGNRRDLVVWLPPGCDGRRSRHPVVYFQDGQNIFDPGTAFLGNAWHAGRAASELIAAGEIEPPIMVGIYNAGFGRMDEYAPTRGAFIGWEGEKCRSRGRGRSYARFVAGEVKPFIDGRYPTLPGREHTTVVGSSMGAIASLYAALWHPRVFGGAGLLSPSAWWDGLAPVRFVRALRSRPAVRLWLDIGTAEPGWEKTRLLRDALVARGWREGADLRYLEATDGVHNEDAWAARVGPLLKWMLGPARPAERKAARLVGDRR
ncbi:MAG TPA: alpha/beta hydrolase-fold protein [Opitutaceae bacterium]|nr:alpha/beta hydrolase-fold protein [Opitutaceae bacterium]